MTGFKQRLQLLLQGKEMRQGQHGVELVLLQKTRGMKVENDDIEAHWALLELLVQSKKKKVYGVFKAALIRIATMVEEMGKKVYFDGELENWARYEASKLSSLWQVTNKKKEWAVISRTHLLLFPLLH